MQPIPNQQIQGGQLSDTPPPPQTSLVKAIVYLTHELVLNKRELDLIGSGLLVKS